MASCELCGCQTSEPVERPNSVFFRTTLCPSCWRHETEGGIKRDFDVMEGHHTDDLFDEHGNRIEREQVEFEAAMPTVGLLRG